ncbi:glycosyltransferase [Azohydromonas sediminis]|uniref:glycosyltransferase n=1 Tax=Azohydromonas sediminis TaxID=2259674 RepID=UPI000E64851E|nr:glycosyltransferase [Azohydromonas sediminis]
MTASPSGTLVTLSVVSHGQGALVRHFLADLRQGVDAPFEVILTLNIPEDEAFLDEHRGLPLLVLRNRVPKGFGANHNAAFRIARGTHFAIVNPDIRAQRLRLAPLLETLEQRRVAACAPQVLAPDGRVEDSARRFPTAWRLLRRLLLRRRGPDYRWGGDPVDVDWLAGMFVLFRRDAYEAVSGFDERYFMYLEDVDICRRLKRLGWRVVLDSRSTVVHFAQRRSHRDVRHLRWHLRSTLRYFTGI